MDKDTEHLLIINQMLIMSAVATLCNEEMRALLIAHLEKLQLMIEKETANG